MDESSKPCLRQFDNKDTQHIHIYMKATPVKLNFHWWNGCFKNVWKISRKLLKRYPSRWKAQQMWSQLLRFVYLPFHENWISRQNLKLDILRRGFWSCKHDERIVINADQITWSRLWIYSLLIYCLVNTEVMWTRRVFEENLPKAVRYKQVKLKRLELSPASIAWIHEGLFSIPCIGCYRCGA